MKPGEGLYSISRTFSVTTDEILKHNPSIEKGVKSGQVLYIPVKDAEQVSALKDSIIFQSQSSISDQSRITSFDESNTFKHIVSLGEQYIPLPKCIILLLKKFIAIIQQREVIKVGKSLLSRSRKLPKKMRLSLSYDSAQRNIVFGSSYVFP